MSITRVLVIALAAGCSNAPAELPPQELHGSVVVSGDVAAGYLHAPQNSRFRIGTFKDEKSEHGLRKTIGSDGVFAVDERNGSALGVPNGDAVALLKRPLTTNADVHNERVLAYFKSAGLPSAQVSGVHVTASMIGSAHGVDESPESVDVQGADLEGFQSVLERTIDGVPVPDSFAWARFNEDDDSVWENVHWPPIPRGVVEAARAMQRSLEATGKRQGLAKLAGVRDPTTLRVTIRHSSFAVEGPVASLASVDAIVDGGKGKARVAHLDLEGRELSLPPERPLRIPDKR
jgi:hypothetical protein